MPDFYIYQIGETTFFIVILHIFSLERNFKLN